ncbi:MAG: FG-GAP-like repeat-containing protein [Acidobacteriota bacterium]
MRGTESSERCRAIILSTLIVSLSISAIACRGGQKESGKPSNEYIASVYDETARAFYVGVAALQVGDDARAADRLSRVTELVPQEPAAWANLGLLAVRRREFDLASERLARALSLAPENTDVNLFLGLLEINRERSSDAISYLRKAIEFDSKNIQANYALAKEIESQGGEKNEAEAQRLMESIFQAQPDNLAVLLEHARLAAKRGDRSTLQMDIGRLSEKTASWPPEARVQFEALRVVESSDDFSLISTRVMFVRNVLVRLPEFQQGYAAVHPPPDRISEPITRFILLSSPGDAPAPPDDNLRFAPEPLPAASGKWKLIGSILLREEWTPSIVVADGRTARLGGGVTLRFPGGASATPPGPDSILGLDFDYDFQTDIAFAGAGGFRLHRQSQPNKFSEATSRTTLPLEVINANYTGAWAADIESDGDLDIVLGARQGPPVVLNNNGDGTFKPLKLFEGAEVLRSFVWADLDGDGDPDAGLLSAGGRLQVFSNERLGRFRERSVPQTIGKVAAIAAADLNSDGILDLIALLAGGTIIRLSDRLEGQDWDVPEIARWQDAPDNLTSETSRLFVADLDNNGGLDLAASGPVEARVWLSDVHGAFQPLAAPLTRARIFSVADLEGDGRLDLLGISDSEQPVKLVNRGQRDYQWKEVRTRAKQATGDQRINPFGIGGEIEIRAGLLVQKQPINGPLVHFGLGQYRDVDVLRIVWPNGSMQAEFDLKSDIPSGAPAVFDQRLEGSCPFLFANNGKGINFITDFIWRSPLGLRINAQDTASVMQTEDWVKIRGDQLAPVEGFYDLRITAELWETHFFDHVSLMTIDHPIGTDVFIDERFAAPPPELKVYAVAPPRSISRALDDTGQDVTEIVGARDSRYLDTFGRGQYQGVTRDHFVEIELGEDAPRTGSLWLIAYGWVHPTDSSINVALAQGRHAAPQGLSLEVPDGKGGWRVAKSGLGFPEGKNKTILLNLDGVFAPAAPPRLRLRTNLEIYWDSIQWAAGLPEAPLQTRGIQAISAELRYRGFSVKSQADNSSPELPDYNRLASTLQRRRDLVGYHTRFGDVRELLERTDDRYVIMNAGDEMAFRFSAGPPAPDGWVRDFVLIGDGWVKDGNYNTTFSKTVLPLPSHDQPDYTKPPGRLEDDPVYRRHAKDWQDYHTRFVTPRSFQTALRVAKRN